MSRFVFTPMEVDGTLEGPDLEPVRAAAEAAGAARRSSSTQAASARSSTCAGSRRSTSPALAGVIVGRALYEGRFTVGEAVESII